MGTSKSRIDDVPALKPSGCSGADVARAESCHLSCDDIVKAGKQKKQTILKIGTWNVRTMNVKGKLENVKEEMRRYKLNVLGVTEVRWLDEGDFESDKYRVIYSGGEERQTGAAVLLDRDAAKRVIDIKRYGDRMMMVKMQGELADMVLIQLYMPTSVHEDDEVDAVYEELEELLRVQKGSDHVVIMGDWNAVVGEGRDELVIGKFGLGTRNERGDKLVDFCKRNRMVVTNTWFEQERRCRYTWKKPGDECRDQIDYILVR